MASSCSISLAEQCITPRERIVATAKPMPKMLASLRSGSDATRPSAVAERGRGQCELSLLTARRTDLVIDRTRALNRLRATLLEFFPGLEAAFDYAKKRSSLLLLTRYQTPEQLRRAGARRVSAWLKKSGAIKPDMVAETALSVAKLQRTVVRSQAIASWLVAELAEDVLRLYENVKRSDRDIEALLHQHPDAEIMLSLPGFAPRARRGFPCSDRRRADRYRDRRSSGRNRWSSTGPTRLGSHQRQPPPTAEIRQTAAARELPRCPERGALLSRLAHLLREETR